MQCSILSMWKISFKQEQNVVRNVFAMIATRNHLINHSRRCFSTNKPPPYGQYVHAEVSAGVATLTLNDAKKRNALSSGMMTELRDSIDFLESDPKVKVVVIRNDGKVFSSGHDLKELQVLQKVSGTTEAVFQLCSSLMLKVRSARFPVIAEVSGLATAGGCQLVAACDLALAADNATFSTPGVRIGLFCTTPGVAIGRALPTKAAMHMLLTGEALPALEAQRLGLVNRVVPAAELRAAGQALAQTIAQAPGQTVAVGKQAFYKQMSEPDTAKAYAFAQGVMVDNMGYPDATEGVDAFLAKRDPRWVT